MAYDVATLAELFETSYRKRMFGKDLGRDDLESFLADPDAKFFLASRDGSLAPIAPDSDLGKLGGALSDDVSLVKIAKRATIALFWVVAASSPDEPERAVSAEIVATIEPTVFFQNFRDVLTAMRTLESRSIARRWNDKFYGPVADAVRDYSYRDLAYRDALPSSWFRELFERELREDGFLVQEVRVSFASVVGDMKIRAEKEEELADLEARLESVRFRKETEKLARDAKLRRLERQLETERELDELESRAIVAEVKRKTEIAERQYEFELELEALERRKRRAILCDEIDRIERAADERGRDRERERETFEIYVDRLDETARECQKALELVEQGRAKLERSVERGELVLEEFARGKRSPEELNAALNQAARETLRDGGEFRDALQTAKALAESRLVPTLQQILESESYDFIERMGLDSTPQALRAAFKRRAETARRFELLLPKITTRDVFAERSRQNGDSAPIRANALQIGRSLAFEFQAPVDGILSFINVGTSGRSWLLLPNADPETGRPTVVANRRYRVPGDFGEPMFEGGPVGWEEMLVFITASPLFTEEDLRSGSKESFPFIELDFQRMLRLRDELNEMDGSTTGVGILGFNVVS
ncbi:MAG: hypothetical protein IJM30_09330 [Thermoguttaceae bacterium]|nr:hypothetical protein [Thermoguttaceae bacterium]